MLATESNGVQMVNMRGLLKSFPIIALAFNCQTTLLPIYNELPNPTIKRMSKVKNLNFLIKTHSYLCFNHLLLWIDTTYEASASREKKIKRLS